MFKLRKYKRAFCFFLIINLFFEVVSPTVSLALTQGLLQPEYETFEPADSVEMVDLFSGDFKYNIPLMEIDGYPINLGYHAGATMDQEASWVGLGWNINSGSLNRYVKGLPDDFNGDMMLDETYIKTHIKTSQGRGRKISGNLSLSVFGFGGMGGGNTAWGSSAVYDNYKGYGVEKFRDWNYSYAGVAAFGAVGETAGGGHSINSLDGGSKSSRYGEFDTYGFKSHSNSSSSGTENRFNSRTGDQTTTDYQTYVQGLVKSKEDFNKGGNYFKSLGQSGSSTLPSTSVGYQPKIAHNLFGLGSSAQQFGGVYACFGIQIYFVSLNVTVSSFYGTTGSAIYSSFMNKSSSRMAYGYLNLQNSNEHGIMDFNSNAGEELYKETPRAPMGASTYDLFSATAHGLGHSFRAYRNDIGVLYNNKTSTRATLSGFGSEYAGYGAYRTSNTKSKNYYLGMSGGWKSSANQALDYKKPSITANTGHLYEETYFKALGEVNKENDAYIQKIGGDTPIKHHIAVAGFGTPTAVNSFPGAGTGLIYNDQRTPRENNIKYLNTTEASLFGLDKQIRVYDATSFVMDLDNRQIVSQSAVDRSTLATSIGHHISEVTVTNNQGARYIYGIPVYNKTKKSIIFNISDKKSGANISKYKYNDGSVEYDASDNSQANQRGLEHLYHTETTPAYAQNYLLTTLLSPNYVDINGDGPSDDDFGDYVKFNYSKVDNYKWRAPYPNGLNTSGTNNPLRATYDKGLIGDELDDKAHIMYGEKDLWYAHSIETKNHIVLFYTSDRMDCHGVDNENGSVIVNTVSPKQLDRIEMYSKTQYWYAQKNNVAPVPIKTVHFKYNYNLCKNTYNNVNYIMNRANNSEISDQTGKLTLEEIYFTYGSSKKGRLSPYTFHYGDVNHNNTIETAENALYNPNYNPKMIDRWGNYKLSSYGAISNTPTSALSNDEFPYSEQDGALADQFSSAWNLSTINTPTGAKINVDYEADDYGYVQNEVAGQMVKIKSVSASKTLTPSTLLLNGKYLLVDLESMGGIPYTTGTSAQADADEILRKKILNNEDKLYYKCFVKLSGSQNTDEAWDFVPAYTSIDLNDCSVQTGTGTGVTFTDAYGHLKYKYAYISQVLQTAEDRSPLGTNKITAVTRAAWQYNRMYIPRVAYPGSEPANYSSPVPVQAGLSTAKQDLLMAGENGQNLRFLITGMGMEINLNKSFARVRNFYKNKKGGGHRVKRITTEDNWDLFNPNESKSVYGLEYDYTKSENEDNISSGVASYEPLIGGDEISLRKRQEFSVTHHYAPNDNYFVENPVGEFFYPSPMVGYSKVKIKNIGQSITAGPNTGSAVCGNGHIVYEFYTAKDFPIITKQTSLEKPYIQHEFINNLTLATLVATKLFMSQGFTLKFNNMHGVLKGKYVFNEKDSENPVSGQTYLYKSKSIGNGSFELDNTVNLLSSREEISEGVMGRNIDISNTVNYNLTRGHTMMIEKYKELSACSLIPTSGFIFKFGRSVMEFGSMVTTKIEQKQGILEKVVSFEDHTINTFENLVFDENTGNPVITKISNNNNESVYSYDYPAYWGYPRMGLASDNEGVRVRDLINTTTGQVNSAYLSILNPGDEIIVTGLTIDVLGNYNEAALLPKKFWVHQPNPSNAAMELIDANGVSASSYATLTTYTNFLYKVVRSGKRNMPRKLMANVTTLQNPVVINTGPSYIDATLKVISASAVEYSENWNSFCTPTREKVGCTNYTSGVFNPYNENLLGNWVAYKSYEYKTLRNYNHSQNNIKSDGTYIDYKQFWKYDLTAASWLPVHDATRSDYNSVSPFDKWIKRNEITIVSPYGHVLEEKDRTNQYHATLMGYNNTLSKGTISRAMYREFGVENFEDYKQYKNLTSWIPCHNDHMGIYPYINNISTSQAHTGLSSLWLSPALNVLAITRTTTVVNETCTNSDMSTECKCINGFSPVAENPNARRYIMSMWVKANNNALLDYTSLFNSNVYLNGSPLSFNFVDKTQIINGWQKFDYEFTIPASTAAGSIDINVQLTGLATTGIYIDDFRIHPYNATMGGQVFDPSDHRLCATLDDRNFATIYEYDHEGTLIRTKKETEKGLYTLLETRTSIKKK